MVLKKDEESGEFISNKAGDKKSRDQETFIVPQDKAEASNVKKQDALAEAEKTRTVWGSKKPAPKEKPTDYSDELNVVPCVGWLVVLDGPGKGKSHELHPGLNSIGRGKDCDVTLSGADDSVSEDGKIGIGYEYQGHSFAFVNRGSKNPPFLNGKPIWTEAVLEDGDTLNIGETTLIFVPFCDKSRNWS